MSSTRSSKPYAACSFSRAPTKLLLRIPVRYRDRSRRAYSISSVFGVPRYSRQISPMKAATCRSSRPRRSPSAWCTSSSVILPMLPSRKAPRMRSLSSPADSPSRLSHVGTTPRSGVISSTPPISNTTAQITMPLFSQQPDRRAGGVLLLQTGKPRDGDGEQGEAPGRCDHRPGVVAEQARQRSGQDTADEGDRLAAEPPGGRHPPEQVPRDQDLAEGAHGHARSHDRPRIEEVPGHQDRRRRGHADQDQGQPGARAAQRD